MKTYVLPRSNSKKDGLEPPNRNCPLEIVTVYVTVDTVFTWGRAPANSAVVLSLYDDVSLATAPLELYPQGP